MLRCQSGKKEVLQWTGLSTTGKDEEGGGDEKGGEERENGQQSMNAGS